MKFLGILLIGFLLSGCAHQFGTYKDPVKHDGVFKSRPVTHNRAPIAAAPRVSEPVVVAPPANGAPAVVDASPAKPKRVGIWARIKAKFHRKPKAQ